MNIGPMNIGSEASNRQSNAIKGSVLVVLLLLRAKLGLARFY